MKFAVVTSQYPAASHTFIRREIQELRERGMEIHTFSIRRPSKDELRTPIDRNEFENTWYVFPFCIGHLTAQFRAFVRRPRRYLSTLVKAYRHRVPGLRALVWAFFHFMESMCLALEIERRGIRHIHNHFANSGANVGFLAAYYLGLRWSLTLHGISEFDYPAGVLLPAKIASAQFVACVSHFGKAQAMRAIDPAYWEKLFISRCGVDLNTLPPSAPPRDDSSRIRWVSVGRLSPEKGQMGLLCCLSQALEKGLDIEMRIVGSGPCRDQLESEIRKRELGTRCVLLGVLPEPEALTEIAAADIFVLTSFMEGLPVVLMEALGMGIPVVAPRVAGIPELVEHQKTGLLYHPGCWDDLFEQLQALSTEPGLRRRCAEAGRIRVRNEFAIKHAVEPIARALCNLSRLGLLLAMAT
jgi:glycosyltransferase involved in cell wall biosynthesis